MKKSFLLPFLSIFFFSLNAYSNDFPLHLKHGQGGGTRSIVEIPVSADLSDNRNLTVSFLSSVTKATVNIEDVSTNAVVYSQEWNSSSDLTIDVSGYKSRMYYLDVTIGGSVYAGTFIIN